MKSSSWLCAWLTATSPIAFCRTRPFDLIDEAGSHCNLHNEAIIKLDEARRTLQTLKRDQEALENQIANSSDDVTLYEREAELRSKVLRLEDDVQKLEAEARPTEITTEDIARVVEMWTGIPVQRINESETEKLVKLEDRLHQRVIGQQQAVSALARAIRRNRAGFGKKRNQHPYLRRPNRRRQDRARQSPGRSSL